MLSLLKSKLPGQMGAVEMRWLVRQRLAPGINSDGLEFDSE